MASTHPSRFKPPRSVSAVHAFSLRPPLQLLLGGVVVASLINPPPAGAQLVDSFDDGDFHTGPGWTGQTERWQIGDMHGPALQSNGAATADTIYLSLTSEAAFGTWEFAIEHRSVNLSSFNGSRIFLISDRENPRQSAVGYYLQFGTNNADAISLWRSDGSLASQRVELARSTEPLAAGDSNRFHIVAERDAFGRFRVYANDVLILSATDRGHTTSSFFSIWVKHSALGAQSFLFDDVAIAEVNTDDFEGPVPQSGDIVINEVLFDPSDGATEFIELQNRGGTSFDLRLLWFRDAQSDPIPISYTSYALEPGEFAVVAGDASALGTTGDGVPLLQPEPWPPLNNGGDTIVLTGPDGTIDSLSYDGSGSIRGVSLERIDPDGPTEPYNFATSVDDNGSTPGRINSIFAIDEEPPRIRFVEQTGRATLELHFSEPVRTDDITPSAVRYISPALDIEPLSETSIRILVDGPPTEPSIGVDNIRDRKGNRSESLTHDVAFLPQPGELALSEIMYEPLVDPYDGRADQVEFVELVNAGSRRLSVAQFMRTRREDDAGNADTLRFGQAFAALMPGAFLVVSNHDSADVRAAFPSTSVDAPTVYVRAGGLTLPNGGDLLRIHNRLGEPLDEVAYEPKWHHPDLAVTRGFSLERIDTGASVADAANWSSSAAAEGASPGAANSLGFVPSPAWTSTGITVEPSPFSPDGDGHDDAAVISYRVRSANPNIRIRIYDLDGFEVRALVPAALAKTEGRVVWDGRDNADRMLRIGIYIIVFEAVDAESRLVEQYKRPVVLARSFR